jgi:predicted lactoylglutathione lyase
MIAYVTLGTNDLDRAAKFYDALLAEVGAKRLWQTERGIGWGTGRGKPALSVMKPFDGKPATVGNGGMVSLQADSREMVDRIHKKALELGGTDEGPAGLRDGKFYIGYFRDLDGNKLNAYFYK